MEQSEIEKMSKEWMYYLSDKRLDEIIDIPQAKIKLMKKWNRFILKKKVKPEPGIIFSYVKEFVGDTDISPDVFDFLTLLYCKCVLSQDEIKDIICFRLKKGRTNKDGEMATSF
jgi:hypothetical protein